LSNVNSADTCLRAKGAQVLVDQDLALGQLHQPP
jgi:hypothetical protein